MTAAKRRLMVVVGTRPEAVKMAPVVLALRREAWAETQLVATGQHGALLTQALADFGLQPDIDLAVMRPAQALADVAARTMAALDPVLAAQQPPELVLAQGDTSSVLVAALCAFWRRIPFAHVEAGLRTGDLAQPFPEEANRSLVARIAALHFAPTEAARQALLREQVPAAQIHLVGNTGIDALLWTAARSDAAAFAPSAGRRLLLVTAHRRENLGAPLAGICQALRTLAARGDVEVLLPVHPHPEVRALVQRELAAVPQVRLCEPLAYPQMVAAMQAATLVLTDSGGVQEEAPSLGRPVLVLRQQTERPEAVAAGSALVVGTDGAHIVAAASRLLDDAAALAAMSQPRLLFGDGHAADAIVRVLRQRFGH